VSDSPPAAPVSLAAIFRTFLIIGATSFGGGVVAYLREMLVEKRRWLEDEQFLSALEISQTLPGLNATNMSIIVGDRLRQVPGALAAFLGMVLPGTVVIMILGILYGEHAHNPAVDAALDGVAAAAVGLLLAVTVQIGRREMRTVADLVIALVTCLAVSELHVPLYVALVVLGAVGIWLYRPKAGARQPER
jgi:chromate transporter